MLFTPENLSDIDLRPGTPSVFKRGVHKGHSPLQLSGMTEAGSDWLVALGYPPAQPDALPTRTQWKLS